MIYENKRIQGFLAILQIIGLVLLQLFIVIIFYAYIQLYNMNGMVVGLCYSILPVGYYVLLNWQYEYSKSLLSLYRHYTPLIILMITVLQSSISYVGIIILSLHLLLKSRILLEKILYAYMCLISIFIFKKYFLNQIGQTKVNEMRFSLINLAIIFVLVTLLILFLRRKLIVQNSY